MASPDHVIVPVVVIVPPLMGHVVAIDDTEAFEVLHDAQVRVPPLPTTVKLPPRGAEGVSVDVATPATPAPPVE